MKRVHTVLAILISLGFIFTGYKYIDKMSPKLPIIYKQTNSHALPATQSESPINSSYHFQDDDYYLKNYIYGLDIVMPDLTFTDATQIKSNDLFMFFRYIVDAEQLYNYQDWFDNHEKMYHIPVSVIEPILKKYLNINSFYANTIKGYDKERNEIITPDFAGFGGDRQAKLDKKEYLGNNTIRLTATFYYYDNTYSKPLYTNVYVIQLNPEDDKYYKYLSIIHETP